MATYSLEYFRERSIVDPKTGCWVWQRFRLRGYGHCGGGPAHRLCYQVTRGITLPREIFVCHQCDNPACVNPDHMFTGTHTDNMRDCVAKGRSSRGKTGYVNRARKGDDNPQAKITSAQVLEIRKSDATHASLGRLYGVTPRTIRRIRRRLVWKHIP